MTPNFDNLEFKTLLKDKEVQIYLRTKEGIQESENFKKIHRLLISFREENSINDFTAIIIKKEDVESIADDINDKLFITLRSDRAISNNHLFVDKDFSLLHCERKEIKDNNEARRLYLELSNEYCVFLITPDDVHYFVDGNDIGKAIFFTSDARKSYNELKDISKIWEVFEEYRYHLKLLDTFRKFFVTVSAKKSLFAHLIQNSNPKLSRKPNNDEEKDFLDKHIQLLNNSPEDNFREDLRYFLESRLKAQLLSKEYIMENFRRLDIYILDDFGELYLIEVKWVGLSIHREGQKLGTSFSEKDINPDAIVQCVDYIKQLAEEGKNVKIGYLAVFDARDEDLTDTAEGFDEDIIESINEKYFRRYRKIPDFRVKNLQPNLI